MSYQVLARKWRPNNFNEVVGQQHVLQSLVNALEQQRLHHAYLFSGTRGVGKTSIARLLAKALNCEKGVSANPCGQCSSCLEIAQGNFVDLIEIDAASKTKVEDTREILDNVQYKPTRGRYKVYLIDEVHMLSRSSFNALLKTLEEPPEHVKFLLATTETQKLPVTILSRCLQFNLKALSIAQIENQLAHILTNEGIAYDDKSLTLLSDAADGSMRDALSLTDQAIAYGEGRLNQTNVQAMLGTLDPEYSLKILSLIISQQAAETFELVEEISQFSPDYDKLLKQIALDIHYASMSSIVKQVVRLGEQPAMLVTLAQQTDAELLQLLYTIVLQGRKELPWAPDPRSGFEMVILRLLAFLPGEKKTIFNDNSVSDTQEKLTAASNTMQPKSPSPIPSIEVLEQQQENLLAQASQLKSKPTAQAAPAMAQPETEKPEVVDEQTLLRAKPDATAPANPSNFSQDELLNMSMAMSHEDEANFIDVVDYSHVASELMPVQAPESQPISSSLPPQAPITGINQFLNARKSLKEKAKSAEKPGEQVKKPQAVKDQRNTPPLLPVDTTVSEKSDLTQSESSEEVVGPTTKIEIPKEVLANEASALAMVEDPATLLAPNTDDYWSNLIDEMGLGGRIRQLGIHSTFTRDENNVALQLATKHKHLGVETAVLTMQKNLCKALNAPIELQVTIGDSDTKSPFTIAQELHDLRLTLARDCIEHDSAIIQLKQEFGAELDPQSVKYRTIKAIN